MYAAKNMQVMQGYALTESCGSGNATDLSSPVAATKLTLRSVARRHIALNDEIGELDAVLDELTAKAAPGLLAKTGVGTEVAGQLLVTAGRQPRAATVRSLLRPSHRSCPHPCFIGAHQPPPSQPGW